MADTKDVVTKEFNPKSVSESEQQQNNAQLRAVIQQLNKRIAALEKRVSAGGL